MPKVALVAMAFLLAGVSAGCGREKQVGAAGAPPATVVEHVEGVRLVTVDHPERFPVFVAQIYRAPSALRVTGTVAPDVSRTIPVISLASGRVLAIQARIGDRVKKGQLLMRIESVDVSSAYSTYRKAAADKTLAEAQANRAQLLFVKGAISRNDMEIARDTAQKASVDLQTARQGLKVLGVRDPDARESSIVNVYAPASGVIVAQNVTVNAAAGVTYSGSSTAFTIADLSHVWILCDVYENDLPSVQIGQKAKIQLNAYPGQALTGTVSEISPILDPSLRTAKVRIQVANPRGLMRVGMFATATLYGKSPETHAIVPSSAILHLHDRDWVYIPAGQGSFRRIDVEGGDMLPGGMQEVVSGVEPGQPVVSNALELENTVNP